MTYNYCKEEFPIGSMKIRYYISDDFTDEQEKNYSNYRAFIMTDKHNSEYLVRIFVDIVKGYETLNGIDFKPCYYHSVNWWHIEEDLPKNWYWFSHGEVTDGNTENKKEILLPPYNAKTDDIVNLVNLIVDEVINDIYNNYDGLFPEKEKHISHANLVKESIEKYSEELESELIMLVK